ncbi:MAG: hypothetical protein ACRDRL_30055 [Sciscionella sp.]
MLGGCDGAAPLVQAHPERKEIARYLLSRGLDPLDLTPESARLAQVMAAAAPVNGS